MQRRPSSYSFARPSTQCDELLVPLSTVPLHHERAGPGLSSLSHSQLIARSMKNPTVSKTRQVIASLSGRQTSLCSPPRPLWSAPCCKGVTQLQRPAARLEFDTAGPPPAGRTGCCTALYELESLPDAVGRCFSADSAGPVRETLNWCKFPCFKNGNWFERHPCAYCHIRAQHFGA